jgi:hypothetical protein
MTCSSEDEKHRCRVCGLWHKEPPWGDNCDSPTFFICECCGTEAGYEDNELSAVRKNRERWLADGANCFDPDERPEGWSVEEQFEKVPEKWK